MSTVQLTKEEKKLAYRCIYCCKHPVWDCWKIDITSNDIESHVEEWQLKCSGLLHCFAVSYSQDKTVCIQQWNDMMSNIYDKVLEHDCPFDNPGVDN